MIEVNHRQEYEELSYEEKTSLGDLGAQVAKVVERARRRANKLLKPLGFMISVQINFHKVENLSKDLKE